MTIKESMNLFRGDLVVIGSKQETKYKGMVFEVVELKPDSEYKRMLVTLKQPGFDEGFRIVDYDSRRLNRYEGTN